MTALKHMVFSFSKNQNVWKGEEVDEQLTAVNWHKKKWGKNPPSKKKPQPHFTAAVAVFVVIVNWNAALWWFPTVSLSLPI